MLICTFGPLGFYSSTGDEKRGKSEGGGGGIQCFTCEGYGHKAIECNKRPGRSPKTEKRCFYVITLVMWQGISRLEIGRAQKKLVLPYTPRDPQKTTRIWSRALRGTINTKE